MSTAPTILAIESSCDETSAALLYQGKVLNNIIATQSIHENYGGVVPELASRAHQSNIVPVVEAALKEAELGPDKLDAVAYTRGPGLLGALLVGSAFAKGLAISQQLPLIAVNHMEAHVLAHFIEEPSPEFPFICLTVSGGHTQLILVKDYLKMEIIGQTQDDAVGEAFDKTAKLLGFPYPGGSHIDKLAQLGDPQAFDFPRTEMPGWDYSFSGIKTAVLYFIRDQEKLNPDFIAENREDLSASIQYTLIEMLVAKLIKAAAHYDISTIAIGGGVSANLGLRKRLKALAADLKWKLYIPHFQHCTDNAAMIAQAAYYKFLAGDFSSQAESPDPRLPVGG